MGRGRNRKTHQRIVEFMKIRIDNVTVATYLDTRNSKKSEGVVRIRVQHTGGLYMVSTFEKMTKSEYKKAEKNNTLFSDNIMDVYMNVVEKTRSLVRKEIFTIDRLRKVLNKVTKGNRIQEVIEEKINDLIDSQKIKTASVYRELSRLLLKLYGEDLLVTDITPQWITKFKQKLRDRGNGNTTISIRMRCLRHILNLSEDNGTIQANPMTGKSAPKIPQWNKRDIAISEKTLSRLLNASKDQVGEVNWYWLQFWKFQYYANGINVVDMLRLKKTDICNGEIRFTRRKTEDEIQIEVIIPITLELSNIISVLGTGKEHIFPFLDNCPARTVEERRKLDNFTHNVNVRVQKCCEELNISEHLTTYTARHTYATRLISKGVPLAVVSKSMGHSSIHTTMNYLDNISKEKRLANAKLLKA